MNCTCTVHLLSHGPLEALLCQFIRTYSELGAAIKANASYSVHAGIQHSTFRDAFPPALIITCWDHLMMLCEYISVGVYVQTEDINERCRKSCGNERRINHERLIQLNLKKLIH